MLLISFEIGSTRRFLRKSSFDIVSAVACQSVIMQTSVVTPDPYIGRHNTIKRLQLENLVNHIEYIKGPPRYISVQCRDEDYSECMNSFIGQINGEAVLLYKKANTRYFYLFTNEEAEEVKEFQYEGTQRAKIRYWRS